MHHGGNEGKYYNDDRRINNMKCTRNVPRLPFNQMQTTPKQKYCIPKMKFLGHEVSEVKALQTDRHTDRCDLTQYQATVMSGNNTIHDGSCICTMYMQHNTDSQQY